MQKKKTKIITLFFIVITIFLVGAIFYISNLLNDKGDTTSLAPHKAKAASITYSKLIALGQSDGATVTPEPTSGGEEITSQPEDQRQLIAPTKSTNPTSEPSQTPGPTETILAYANPTVTGTQNTYNNTDTITPTKVATMPETGYVYNGLIIFAASMVLVFFSFLF